MKCQILHESKNRIRVHLVQRRMTMEQADILEYYLRDIGFITDARVRERTCDVTIRYYATAENREKLIQLLSVFSYEDEYAISLVPEKTGRELSRAYERQLVLKLAGRIFRKLFFPAPLMIAWTVIGSIGFILRGIKSLLRWKIEISVLDAIAILASMIRADFETASSVMFLLEIGEILEQWTYRKSVDDLARSMSLNVDKVWLNTGSEDVLVDIKSIEVGDKISVGSSNIIPLDGKVVAGYATVNQASMTGESVPVEKTVDGYVYAGTVVEEGELVIEVVKKIGSGKYDQIVKMIEENEKLKSNTETRAYKLADKLVPYSLIGAVGTWILTRNVERAIAFLMVDFSCALKLSMPLSVLSAIKEAGALGITVKGGKYVETVAEADTIVFDKTGTLTHATPTVVKIDTFGEIDEQEVLKIAACLEEHYPHSIANAVVDEAKKRHIEHKEMHSQVQYVVAHGIVSSIDGKRALIGSYHFVFEDEGCQISKEEEEKISKLPSEYSHLYLAIDGKLAGVLHIFDPLRKEAVSVINSLHKLGFKHICMMTGDNSNTAKAIADKLSIDEYEAGVLPEDKAEFIRNKRSQNKKVIMIGDGINDTPALSEADCGIAISSGAAIAREIADITITADSLEQLLFFRILAQRLTERIKGNYNFIIGFNTMLIILGVLGVISPASSALLHNTSTIVTGLRSMSPLLKKGETPQSVI